MKLKKQAVTMIVALVLQYILGMTSNLFVKFPDNLSERENWQFAWTQLPLALHIILGIILLIGSITLVIRSIRAKDKFWIKASSLGLIFIFLAALSGSRFIPTQNDIFSFVMALAFLGALLSYSGGIHLSVDKP